MKISKIDFKSPNAPQELVKSFRETGFAIVTNHTVSVSMLDQTYEDWIEFFRSRQKNEYKFDVTTHEGYFPFKSENAKDSQVKDLKEFFHLYNPLNLPFYIGTDATIVVRRQMIEVASQLLGMVQSALPEDVKTKLSVPLPEMIRDSKQTLLRILHYPPIQGEVEPGAVRAAAHEDINLITILPAATEPGLEVLGRDGNWYMADSDPGNLIVNVGDMLQMATDGFLPSTTHRVVNPLGEAAKLSRYSMPLFLHPRPEVVLRKAQGVDNQILPAVTAEQYLQQRLRELGLK